MSTGTRGDRIFLGAGGERPGCNVPAFLRIVVTEVDEMETNMFRKKGQRVEGHDRYAVYRLIGRRIAFANPKRRSSVVEGTLLDVSRDIFEDTIDLELCGGRKYSFKEPTAMLKRGVAGVGVAWVTLLYGDARPDDGTDEELFKAAEEKGFKENVHEVLKRTAPRMKHEVRIYALPDEPGRRRRKRRPR